MRIWAIAAIILAGAPGQLEQPPRRVAAVLGFEGPQRELARRLADCLRLKWRRQAQQPGSGGLEVLSWVETEQLRPEGAPPALETPPAEMASLLERFAVDIGLWGRVRRDGQRVRLELRAVDIRFDRQRLWIEEIFEASGERAVPLLCRQVVERLAGQAGPEPARAPAGPEPPAGPAINRNSGFELGRGDRPDGWERIDGLTTFWLDDPTGAGRGKVLKMDTRILQSQASQWWAKWRAGAAASQAPAPLLSKPPFYNSVAGQHGAHFYSAFYRIEPGRQYRISADLKGSSTTGCFAKVFVKGYSLVGPAAGPGRPERREVWRTYLACRNPDNAWRHYWQRFRPDNDVQWLRIVLYAHWPPGIYYWDNVRLSAEPGVTSRSAPAGSPP
ncbi:MAG: hypothetical protein ACE5K7_00135 [Phycisphaerae bacterium]